MGYLTNRVGLVNELFKDLGLIERSVLWLGDKDLALLAVVVSIVWKTVGLTMILLLAGLQAIPRDVYEAARVDGRKLLDGAALRHDFRYYVAPSRWRLFCP